MILYDIKNGRVGMKRQILILSTLIITLYGSNTNISTVEPALDLSDSNGSKQVDRYVPGYMPRIITPDSLKSGFYGGLGVSASWIDFSNSIESNTNKMLDLLVIAGYNYNKYLAIESRARVSAAYDNGLDVTSVSFFIKPKYEINKKIETYALIGYGQTKAHTINSKDIKGSINSAKVGIGADYKLGNNFKLFTDFIYHGKDKDAQYNNIKSIMKSSSVSGGITYDF